MNKEGIRNLLEKMLPVKNPETITDCGDRTVWISDVAEVFYKIANTDLNNPNELKAGGKYLCTSVRTSNHGLTHGMIEVECLEVTEKAYKVIVDGTPMWIQKEWKMSILEVLNEPTIDPKFDVTFTASTVTHNEIRNDADIGFGYGDDSQGDLPF